MIPIIGIIVGLYTITRYAEMFKSKGTKGKVWLIVVGLVTAFLMIALISNSNT